MPGSLCSFPSFCWQVRQHSHPICAVFCVCIRVHMCFNGKERKIETKALTNGTPKVRIAEDMAGKAG